MELIRAGEALLRSASSLSAAAAPFQNRSTFSASRRLYRPTLCRVARQFSASASTLQESQSGSDSSPRTLDVAGNITSKPAAPEKPQSSALSDYDRMVFDRALEFGNDPLSARHTHHFKNPGAAVDNVRARERSSADEVQRHFSAWGQGRTGINRTHDKTGGKADVGSLKFPKVELMAKKKAAPDEVPARLSVRTGRMLEVDPTKPTDLGAKLKTLSRVVTANRVKATLNAQKTYERLGLKKKRLRMMRWRRRFKAQFVKTVDRVMELKEKGW
ncbi:hypothetical protein EJ06DRAFT_527050 [Trichodelitschia bisporula]|uniref:Ribosomal protein S21 n=1 Tax=Trichodelitschia bisporula TaxID=703511 RepID=A0A6G1I5T5_9PEZI|nr:hypothetical protein EJ06DRAFT_527050 [Trichodelitschia bisporula]